MSAYQIVFPQLNRKPCTFKLKNEVPTLYVKQNLPGFCKHTGHLLLVEQTFSLLLLHLFIYQRFLSKATSKWEQKKQWN